MANLVNVTNIEFGVNALRKEIHRQRHEVNVAGSLTIAKERSFDAVGTGEHAEFGCGHGRTPVIVRVQRKHDALSLVDVTQEPFDGVGVEVGGVHLDGRGKVQDERPLPRGLYGINHGVANLHRVLEFGASKGLGRVFVAKRSRWRRRFQGTAEVSRINGNLGDALLVETKDDPPLQNRRGVIEVHYGVAGSVD